MSLTFAALAGGFLPLAPPGKPNGFGYPSLYTCAVDIIIYVLPLPTWGLEYGMHRINMEGEKEGGREGIILPKQIPRVEDILLNKHGLTRKKSFSPLTSFGSF